MSGFEELPKPWFFHYQGKPIPTVVDSAAKAKAYVAGEQFGARLLIFTDSYDSAWEIANQHGVAIGNIIEANDPDLPDYGPTVEKQYENGLDCGDIVSVDGVGDCWADYYGWVRQLTGEID